MEPLGLLPCLLGAAAVDRAGVPVGRVADVLYEARTSRPAWILLAGVRAEGVSLADVRENAREECVSPGAGQRAREDGVLLHAPAHAMRHRAGGVELVSPASLIRTAPRAAGPPTDLTAGHARALSVHYGIPVTPGPWHGIAEPVAAETREPAVVWR